MVCLKIAELELAQYDVKLLIHVDMANSAVESRPAGSRQAVVQRFSPEDSIVSEYTFREKSTMMVPDETIFTIFVELNRFGKKLEECETLLDKWCFSLTHINTLDKLPDELRTEAFERLFKACEIARFEPEVKLKYEKEMITERDYYNMLNTAKADGLAAGLAEGEAKEKIRIAKVLKEQGVAASIIAAASGLTESQIAEL